ncbi:unnamed protein product, partial [Ectocarpus sp. 12 AP-2014]
MACHTKHAGGNKLLPYYLCGRLKPDHPHASNNLGDAIKDKGLIKEAMHCDVTAVHLMPKFAAVHRNLGSVLKEQGKLVRESKQGTRAGALPRSHRDRPRLRRRLQQHGQ